MGIQHHHHHNVITTGWGVAAKPCDSCKISTAAVFCRTDVAFLCLNCDAKIHGANKLASRHGRVWMCEVCEQAPAAVTCKADAAALCVTCDSDIHSANPLARRHERVPVEPFFDSAESIVKSSGFNLLVPDENGGADDCAGVTDVETAAWLLPNLNVEKKSEIMFFSEMDPFLDFDYGNSMEAKFEHDHNTANDSVVPVQPQLVPAPVIHRSSEICFDIDFCRSKLSSFAYPSQSLSQSISSSSHDVGVVPDGNCMADISYPYGQNMNSSIDQTFGTPTTTNQATQLCGMDREARVLRYKQKRKNRKFEKTIRYASRKAYAETRPRIKGRFAKRTEKELGVDRVYTSSAAIHLADYGVVPTY